MPLFIDDSNKYVQDLIDMDIKIIPSEKELIRYLNNMPIKCFRAGYGIRISQARLAKKLNMTESGVQKLIKRLIDKNVIVIRKFWKLNHYSLVKVTAIKKIIKGENYTNQQESEEPIHKSTKSKNNLFLSDIFLPQLEKVKTTIQSCKDIKYLPRFITGRIDEKSDFFMQQRKAELEYLRNGMRNITKSVKNVIMQRPIARPLPPPSHASHRLYKPEPYMREEPGAGYALFSQMIKPKLGLT